MNSLRYIYKPTIDQLIAALLVLWLNAGMYTIVQRFIPSVTMYGLFALWLVLIMRKPDVLKRIQCLALKFIPAFAMIVIMLWVGKSSLTRGYLMFLIYALIISSIAACYVNNLKAVSFLLKIWEIDVFLVVINSFIQISKYPLLIRRMSASTEAIQKYFGAKIYGVAAFSNILCFVFFALFVFSRIINKKINTKLQDYVVFFALVFLIFESQLAILIATMILGLVLILIVNRCTDKKSLIIYIIVTILVFASLYSFLPRIFILISGMNQLPELLRIKAADLSLIFSGSTDKLADATSRLIQYKKDIICFLHNPLIGTLGVDVEIGGHATWLDMLGMYGLVAIFFMNLHISLLKESIRAISMEERRMIIAISIVYTALGIVDPIIFQNVYMLFLMVIPFMNIKYRSGLPS